MSTIRFTRTLPSQRSGGFFVFRKRCLFEMPPMKIGRGDPDPRARVETRVPEARGLSEGTRLSSRIPMTGRTNQGFASAARVRERRDGICPWPGLNRPSKAIAAHKRPRVPGGEDLGYIALTDLPRWGDPISSVPLDVCFSPTSPLRGGGNFVQIAFRFSGGEEFGYFGCPDQCLSLTGQDTSSRRMKVRLERSPGIFSMLRKQQAARRAVAARTGFSPSSR